MKRKALLLLALTFGGISANAAKLVETKVIDKDYLMVHFIDGEVLFVDDGLGSTAYTSNHDTANNYAVTYGLSLIHI